MDAPQDGIGGAQLRLAAARLRRRGPLRRLADVRGLGGAHRAPHVRVALRTGDGVRLSAAYLPGPRDGAPAVVLTHGFGAQRRKPPYALLADVLAGFAHVLTLDLRGHGGSAGRSTFGTDERRDVAAAVAWLRDRGHAAVVPIGVSMGAGAVLHALATGTRVEAAVVVSSPAWHGPPRSEPLERLRRVMDRPLTRWAWQGVAGFRFVAPGRWEPYPDPVVLADGIDVPLLVVHGRDDHFFPIAEAEALSAAGRGVLWRLPDGFGHAEDGMVPAVAVALGRAVTEAGRTGRFPALAELATRP